jgi:hypothetical protein
MKNYLSTVILLFLGLSLNAQAPQGFNYQATVRNSAGELIIKSNVYFKFNVIQGSQTAVPVFTETHYVPTDDLGQVNLVIGQGTPSTGTFSELDWSLGSYYLGIELSINSANDYVAMGTTQLLSVPYALYAQNSGNATSTTPNLQSVLAENNSAGQQQIKNLLDPTDGSDAVTKSYADALSNTQGLMNFNGWDNYQVWEENTTINLTPNSFVFINANNTTLVFPDGPDNCCFGDVIYVYVMDGDPLTPLSFNLQANGFPVAVGGGDTQLLWTSSEVISGAFNTAGLKTIINVGDFWMVADFQGSISNNLNAQVNPIVDVYVCSGDDVIPVDFSTTNTQGTTQYYWTNDNGSTGIPNNGVNDFGGLGVFNNTSEPQVSTITVTPELTFQGQTTTGPSETFTVTVYPSGQVNQVDDITFFSGETTQPIVFLTSGTTNIWTNDNLNIGLSSSGSGNIPSFTAINYSTTPIVGTITVTPVFNSSLDCFGPSISFTITVNPTEGSVTDQDGNTYNYLTYSDQVWTVENAEMVSYRDDTPIAQVTDATEWQNLTTGAWCYYDNDPTKPRLYNWYAVMGIHDNDENTPNKEFAPEGWHVPTDAEWTTLEEYHINISGFNALPPVGARDPSGSFQNWYTVFWSSTDGSPNGAWNRNYDSGSFYYIDNYDFKQSGISVRFVRD